MRKAITTIIITVIMLTMFYASTWIEAHYTREATVIEVNDNIVTVVDDTNIAPVEPHDTKPFISSFSLANVKPLIKDEFGFVLNALTGLS
mgnify:CR=1 FL=1